MGIAVIKTGGKQYLIKEGSKITIEKLPGVSEGGEISFDSVLLTDDGVETVVGMPTVKGAAVSGKITKAGKGKKVIIIKYKAKSRYFKKRGHRQPYLAVQIGNI